LAAQTLVVTTSEQQQRFITPSAMAGFSFNPPQKPNPFPGKRSPKR